MDERYEKVRKVPKDRLKPIGAGKLAKMTDINAQWRIEIMTEVYGLCGIGWKYEIGEAIHQTLPDGQILLYLPVSVSVKDKETGEWSAPITQFGGDWLIKMEKEKLVGQDEAYKKCLTDALGKALSVLGVAGDIYAGCWDGAKYTEKTVVSEEKDQAESKPHKEQQKAEPEQKQQPPITKDAQGNTLILAKGQYYKLSAFNLEQLNKMANSEKYAEIHDEVRMLMAYKSKRQQ